MVWPVARPLFFLLPPDTAHSVAMVALGPLEYLSPLRALLRSWLFPHDERLVVRTMGLVFPSPVGLAAGFDKNARRVRALSALGFGHLELGTVTAQAQAPNPTPNLFRLPADRALVNRLGFPNEGAARVSARLGDGAPREARSVPLGVSIGKSRVVPLDPVEGVIADYLASFRLVRHAADFVVVNVSSPNTPNLRAMQGAALARALLGALVAENDAPAARKVPLLLKVAPDLTDAGLEDLLAVVEEVKLDGVVATNTTITRAGLATPSPRIEAIGAGGLSGPPLRTRARQIVERTRARLGPRVTLIGVGGVETGEDAVALVRAGANLVQIYTGFIYGGPFTARGIARSMADAVTRAGATTITDLVGVG
jgi:dihydroorotate dehydrogenase